MKDEKINKDEGCHFCRRQSSQGPKMALLPCVFCAGEKLRAARQKTANFILRRMGFAARDSFDLHCAALKAAINNAGGFDNNTKGGGEDDGGNDNHSAFVDNGAGGCGRRFATMAVAFFADGVNAVSREEFDAHCQILAAGEKMQKDKDAKNKSGKSGGGKSMKSAKSTKGKGA
ncbi:MAG: hypothetical protein ACR2PR_11260 [Pseudohongiellaceae bacterium]